ncbi:MAG: MOSC domain-containing [Lasallia pustulata]|uniref:MOSC domain-containing n=1 Tax=Lasallia pustulata TaxID=136370 RepID=A0A5M8PBK6_9LECA|nr:MAG: MOSC domain-containing [Lasallia pustulata]
MKVSQLYTYPIKSLRPVSLTTAELTRHGFPHDRRFMLLKVHPADPSSGTEARLENIHVAHFPETVLFLQEIVFTDKGDPSTGHIVVTFKPPQGSEGQEQKLEIPLTPHPKDMKVIDVVMHSSPAKAYNMGSYYNSWFSECLEYPVIFAYLGPHLRPVLGNLSPNATGQNAGTASSWLSSITKNIPAVIGGMNKGEEGITFADCAAYLVVTEESLQDVSSRLPEGEEMDMTKFRPNIVLTGSPTAWDEDFWGEVTVTSSKVSNKAMGIEEANITLTQNCARCKSINIDYATGKPGKGEAGSILKKLMKDRRVDGGTKYSPIFGRYGFLKAGTSEGPRIAVGDEVTVSKRNEQRTKFDWPGLTN